MKKTKRQKRSNKKQNKTPKRLIKIGLLAIGTIAASFLFFYFSVKLGVFGKLPERATLQKIENNTATEIYSADSVLIGKFYIQERTHARYDELSKHVIDALVATEDARFFEHEGIDYRSLTRVFFKTFLMLDRSSGGGSTISQQLAKNLFPRKDHGWLSIPVSKVKEAIIANRLESIYSKEEILTLYLNTVPFGDNVYGIEMAARRFFNKKTKNLNLQEAAVLIGMLKANYSYNPRLYPENSFTRRNVVLGQMAKYGYITEAAYDSLSNLPLKLNYTKITHNTGIATYFREYLRKELEKWCDNHSKPDGSGYNIYTDGLKIYTTIDSRLQKYAEEAMKKHMSDLQAVFNKHWSNTASWSSNKEIVLQALKNTSRYKNLKDKGHSEKEIMKALQEPVPMKIYQWQGEQEVKMSPVDSVKHYLTFLQTGVLAMEPASGNIKAWVGGINYEFFKYDHVNKNTKRQVGSTFKPLVYAAALEKGMNPCRYISGEKLTYTNLADWSPGNADEEEYDMKYTFKGALAKSVNTVTVRVLEEVGIAETISLAQKAGIESELPEVPSIALGTANISLMEMVTAYCAFANGGFAVKPRYLTAIADNSGKVLDRFKTDLSRERIMMKETAMIMNAMLQEVVNAGTAGSYRWKYHMTHELAGKTGTTQSNTDGWFIGYNPEMVVGAWVGADNPAIRFRTTSLGSGASTAMPIVAKYFHKMQSDPKFRKQGYASFPEIPDYIARSIDCGTEKEDKVFMEWLFGNKKGGEKKTTFDDKGNGKDAPKKKNIFDKIGGIFKKKKDK
ncbi:transglycosylase domain-containing protein [Fulvivirga sp. 29W222]|uniref:Transglycosylase domain-containing protein n=1 Tax=Fulvivirga marina TaxID=2494733 RepID=A0A937KEL4_9BACT|nr:transglycosylase domain-containing protein [Fulvivirga marina]MBL6447288.1 transglycosylase domain-containing protein [Fulvivirga marina]